MIWLVPSALAGLLLVAGPVLVHLLMRRHATRVVFPAMRFVPAVQGAAVRFRAPSDLGLLVLRGAAVTAAAIAAAQPLFVTPARQRAWADRVARAVIVDTSPSVDTAVAQQLAAGEAAGTFASQRFASSDVRDAVHRATGWLAAAPAGRRELAIVSDFQAGAIDAADLASVPRTTGIRLVRANRPAPSIGTPATVDGWRNGRWAASTKLDSSGTSVTWTRQGDSPPAPLTILSAPQDAAAAVSASRAAQSLGVTKGTASRRVEVAFAGSTPAPVTPPSTAWIVSAAIALRGDPLVAASGASVSVGERDGTLSAKTAIPASSPFAPAVIRAVLTAASPAAFDPEREVDSLDEAMLASWRRPPTPLPTPAPPDTSDGRWLWAAALALVLIEGVVRRGAAPRAVEDVHANAA